eukprot:UN04024
MNKMKLIGGAKRRRTSGAPSRLHRRGKPINLTLFLSAQSNQWPSKKRLKLNGKNERKIITLIDKRNFISFGKYD